MLKYSLHFSLTLTLFAACVTTIKTELTDPPVPTLLPTDAGGEGEGEGEGEPNGEGEGEADAGTIPPEAEQPDAGGTPPVDPPPQTTMRGVNHTLWWGWKTENERSIGVIAKTGANTIRLVYGSGMGHSTPEEQRRTITTAVGLFTTVVVENHDATCKTDTASLASVVQWWLDPMRLAYLREFPDVVLNIANEWGPFDVPIWRDAYVDAVTALRDAGVTNQLMIDAGGACGQNPRTVRDGGQAVLDADPLRDVVFSVHMYAYWRTSEATDVGRWNDLGTASPWRIRDEIASIQARGLRVVVGEIGWQGSPQVGYQTREALETLNDLGVGWIAWSWDQNSDDALDMTTFARPPHSDYSEAILSEGGRVFVEYFRSP